MTQRGAQNWIKQGKKKHYDISLRLKGKYPKAKAIIFILNTSDIYFFSKLILKHNYKVTVARITRFKKTLVLVKPRERVD